LTTPPTPDGLLLHVTAVFIVPVTVAVNDAIRPGRSVALGGLRLTATAPAGCRLTVAVAVLAGAATVVANTVADCPAKTLAGAV
jgi:hypothetical protein